MCRPALHICGVIIPISGIGTLSTHSHGIVYPNVFINIGTSPLRLAKMASLKLLGMLLTVLGLKPSYSVLLHTSDNKLLAPEEYNVITVVIIPKDSN